VSIGEESGLPSSLACSLVSREYGTWCSLC
jgi:hypothetical protein